jgi:hypothetical protein
MQSVVGELEQVVEAQELTAEARIQHNPRLDELMALHTTSPPRDRVSESIGMSSICLKLHR